MSYRFVHVSGVYDIIARQIESALPHDRELSYAELLEHFIAARFGWSDVYVREMNAIGNPSVLILPEPLLLRAWAHENELPYSNNPQQNRAMLLKQIAAHQPDVIFLSNLYHCDHAFRRELRQLLCKNVWVIGWRSAPTDDFGAFADLDLMLTGSPLFVEHFRKAGLRAEYLPLAFDLAILDDVPDSPQDIDFTFAGTLGNSRGNHSERFHLISSLMENTPLQIWGEVPTPYMSWPTQAAIDLSITLERIGLTDQAQKRIPGLRRVANWKQEIDESAAILKKKYPSRVHPSVFGLAYFQIMRRSRVSFNSHIDVAGSLSGNIRMFEATGIGSCLLTDWKENITNFFVPDVEVAVYRSAQEAVEKVEFLLEHPTECRAMAQAGQKRTLCQHTYKQRTQQMDVLFQSLIEQS